MCVCVRPIYLKWSENLYISPTYPDMVWLKTTQQNIFSANKNINSIWKSQIENKFYLDEKQGPKNEWEEQQRREKAGELVRWRANESNFCIEKMAIQNPTISAKSLKYKLSPSILSFRILIYMHRTQACMCVCVRVLVMCMDLAIWMAHWQHRDLLLDILFCLHKIACGIKKNARRLILLEYTFQNNSPFWMPETILQNRFEIVAKEFIGKLIYIVKVLHIIE